MGDNKEFTFINEEWTDPEPTPIDLLQGYINLMIEYAKDPVKRDKVLKYPHVDENQQMIKEDLRNHKFIIPDDVFVAYDDDNLGANVFIYRKDEQNPGKIIIEEKSLTVEFISDVTGRDVHPKEESKWVKLNIKKALSDYNTVIVMPFLIISGFKVSFKNEEEIILSTC